MNYILNEYIAIVGREKIEQLKKLAEALKDARIVHINATAVGGGVAEMLKSFEKLAKSLGLNFEWRVLKGDERFFRITKSIHNALQGDRISLDEESISYYMDVVSRNSVELDADVVVIHDPQPLALISYKKSGVWIWRCHIDLEDPDPSALSFVRRFVEKYDAVVVSHEKYELETSVRIYVIHPSIDPLSDKNRPLDRDTVERYLAKYDVDPERPLLGQVARFDPWKDPLGALEVYKLVRERVPGVQLALIGSFAHDDPEGREWYERVKSSVGNDRDVHIITDNDDLMVNAFQRAFSAALQMSKREGFGLSVAEALWKGVPVVARPAGGIPLQIIDGFNGFLIRNVEEAANRAVWLLRNRSRAVEMGLRGREFVRRNFLIIDNLIQHLKLYLKLLQ